MTVFEHREMTEKLLRQPVYYSRWYRCDNPGCKTTQVMPPEFKVQNKQRSVMVAEDRARR